MELISHKFSQSPLQYNMYIRNQCKMHVHAIKKMPVTSVLLRPDNMHSY